MKFNKIISGGSSVGACGWLNGVTKNKLGWRSLFAMQTLRDTYMSPSVILNY
jgi:hypothetical protein